MAKTIFPQPYDPLPEPWASCFEAWRELEYRDLNNKVRQEIQDIVANPAFLPQRSNQPDVLDGLSKAWRQQACESTVWRLLATVSPQDAGFVDFDPAVLRAGNTKGAIEIGWLTTASDAGKRMGEKTIDNFYLSLKGERDYRRDAARHRQTPVGQRYAKFRYELRVPMEAQLKVLASHLDVAHEGLWARMEALLVKNTLRQGMDEVVAETRGRRRL
jgi:hypothetical protein